MESEYIQTYKMTISSYASIDLSKYENKTSTYEALTYG